MNQLFVINWDNIDVLFLDNEAFLKFFSKNNYLAKSNKANQVLLLFHFIYELIIICALQYFLLH